MLNRSAIIPAVFCAMLIAAPARAQSAAATPTGYVNVNGWYQGAPGSFVDVVRPIVSGEAAVVTTTYDVGAASGFEVGAGVLVRRHLAAGIAVSRFSKSGRASVSAQVPQPFYFNRPRPVSGDAANLTRAETAVHAQLTWAVPLTPRWELAIAGGPSWFNLDQDVVTNVSVRESYPFDTAEFAGAPSTRHSASHIGYNAGADVAYMFRPRLGVGVGLNFSRARVPVTDALTVDAGGLHVGGGLRLLF
jgi:hypothetical protein